MPRSPKDGANSNEDEPAEAGSKNGHSQKNLGAVVFGAGRLTSGAKGTFRSVFHEPHGQRLGHALAAADAQQHGLTAIALDLAEHGLEIVDAGD